jgi:hypothetical protein
MAEFVKRRVDVIVTSATPPTVAAKQATSVIPIVFAAVGDAEERLGSFAARCSCYGVAAGEARRTRTFNLASAPFSPPGAFGSCS